MRLRPDELAAPPSASATTPRTPLSLAGAASPFDNFLNAYVPKEHEIAARQAAYNAVALASLAALATGAYLVAFILEPFLVPIFWAVLTGFLLHPYQAMVSRAAKQWLRRAAAASRPLTITVLADILGGTVLMCDGLGCHLLQLWRTLLAVALVAAGLLALATANQNAVLLFYDVLTTVESACQSLAVMDASQWFFTLLAATVGAVGLAFAMPQTVGSHRGAILKALSCFFWFSAAGYLLSRFLATAAILLGAPLCMYVLIAARRYEPEEQKDGHDGGRRRKVSAPLAVFATTVLTSLVPKELHSTVEEAKRLNPEIQVGETPATPTTAGGDDSLLQSAGGSEASAVLEETPARRPAKGLFADHRRQVLIRNSNLSRSISRVRRQANADRPEEGRKVTEEDEPPPSSNAILRVTLTLCVLMQFYLHPRLLHLLPVPAAAFILRRLWLLASLRPRVESAAAALSNTVAGGGYGQILLPAPVRMIYRLVVGAECRLLTAAPAYVDQMVAAAIILAGITVYVPIS